MIREQALEVGGGIEYRRQLEGVTDLIAVARDINGRSQSFKNDCASVREGFSFTGTQSLGQAIGLCEYGWPEGRQKVADLIGRYSVDDALTHRGQTIEFDYDVAGDEPDIDRYLAGEPENMIDYHIDPANSGRNLKLIVNASQSAYVGAETITRRGVAIALAMDMMTAAGYGVGLEMAERSEGYGRRDGKDITVEYRIPVVESGGFVDLDSMTFCLVHPSFLRRLIFSLNEHEPDDIRDAMGYHESGGYGRPRSLDLSEDERAVVVDKDDGLLNFDEEIPVFANELTKRLIKLAGVEETPEGGRNV
jgi:hypothetical protein